MGTPRILIVEDDRKTAASVALYLRHAGYETAEAYTGPEALSRAREVRPDLVVLDLMLPGFGGVGGLEVCRRLRAESKVAVIMVTALSTEADRLRGLDLGADDYVVKPFSPRELVARVRAVLRRTEAVDRPPERIVVGDLAVDPARGEASVGGRAIELTAAEVKLLATLAASPGRVFRRDELMRLALGADREALDRTIDAHVKNLRRKIEDDRSRPRRILTVHGLGYKLVAEGGA